MQDIGDQFYSRILMNFVEAMTIIRKLEDEKQKSLTKLETTLPKEPFMKWGLNVIGPIKPTRRLT
jgi:hypothetical protein